MQKLKPKRIEIERPAIKRNAGLRAKVFSRDQGVCCDCGRYSSKWEHDHAVPLHLGGADTLDNAVTRCRSCHRRKSNRELTAKAKTDRLAQTHATFKQRRSIPIA
jgi:5-methylcytosine-specific restriction endonuclease McrA